MQSVRELYGWPLMWAAAQKPHELQVVLVKEALGN